MYKFFYIFQWPSGWESKTTLLNFITYISPTYSQQKINNTEYLKLRIYKMYFPFCLSFVPFNWFIKWFCWMRWRGTSKSM